MTALARDDSLSTSDAQRRLTDFTPGESFSGAIFAALDLAIKMASSGSPYLQLKLRDCTGVVNAKLWSAPADILQTLAGAQLVSVRGQVDVSPRYRGDFKLFSIEPHPTPADLSPFLPPLPEDYQAHAGRFVDLIRSVREPHLKALLREIFHPEAELWSRFCEAPAAKTMHHAHRGGLLEHSGEVALMCDRMATVLPHIDRDLLVCCALLHDIGKLEELESDLNAGEYTPAGQLVGHIVLGTCLVASAAEQIAGFPAQLKHEVMHLILSHHGEPEWGAARRPMCAEALILSQCDNMSAKVAQCREKAGGDEDFTRSHGWHSAPIGSQNAVYVGRMRERMADGGWRIADDG